MIVDEIAVPTPATGLAARIVRGAFAGFVFTGIANLFLFAGQIIIPRTLSRTDYAEFTVSISFVAMFSLVVDLGLNPLLTRLLAEAEEDSNITSWDARGIILGSALLIRGFMALLVAAIVLMIAPLIYHPSYVSNMSILLLTLVVSSRIYVIRSIGEALLRSRGKYYVAAFFAMIDAAIFALLLLYGRGHSMTLRQVVWIYTACNLPGFVVLVGTLGIWMHREKISLRIDTKLVWKILRLSIPLSLGTAFLTIHNQIDILLLDKWSTPLEVSGYGATIRLISAVAPIAVVLAIITAPELTKLVRRKDYARSQQLLDVSTRILLVISIMIALFVLSCSSDIVRVLLGSRYENAASLLPWIGWMIIPVFLSALLAEANIAVGKIWYPTVYSAVLMVSVIVGDTILIPQFGAEGALASKLMAVILGCMVLVYLSRSVEYLNIRLLLTALNRGFVSCLVGILILSMSHYLGFNSFAQATFSLFGFLTATHSTKLLTLKEVLALSRLVKISPKNREENP